MAINSLAFKLAAAFGWTAANNLTGADYGQNQNNSSPQKSLSIGTAVANNVAGGGDELYSTITTIAPSGNATIDLTSITDILQQTAISLARAKVIIIRLLSSTDDATNGTAASSVTIDNTVTNGLSAQSHSGWFDNGAEGAAGGSKFAIINGGIMLYGTPSATGILVDSTHKLLKIVNNDGALSAKVQVTVCGGST